MSAPAHGPEPEWVPDGDILSALDGIDDSPALPARIPTFTPRQVVREPMMAENRAALRHLAESIEAIDFAVLDKARENGQPYATALAMAPAATGPLPVQDTLGAARGRAPLFDATFGAHYGTGPQPSAAPPAAAAEPEPDSTWLLDFLGNLLDDAAEGAGRRITTACPSCTSISGWCEECQDALARAAQYSRLAELVEGAAGDRAAVLVLMAGAWRQTAPGDAATAEGRR